MTGKTSIGEIAESCLVAYSPEENLVHYMCVTSMGEVHDHKGAWTANNGSASSIEFLPFEGFLSGKSMTEKITWRFPNQNTLETSSIVTLPDHSTMTFKYTGQRKR